MKPSDDLFQLIKAMSMSEKRYFKMFSSLQSGDKTYLILFDAIDKQEHYNEQDVKEEFAIKNLAIVKHYLHDTLMKSLEVYHSGSGSELQRILQQVTILYKKGLYRQCEKLIAKGKELAEAKEDFFSLTRLLTTRTFLTHQTGYLQESRENVEAVFNELDLVWEKQKNKSNYARLVSRASKVLYRDTTLRSKEDMKLLEDIINDPLLKNEKNALSTTALFNYYQCHVLYNIAHGNYLKILDSDRKKMDLVEKYPRRMRNYVENHMAIMWDIHSSLSKLKKFPEMLENIKMFRGLPQKLKAITEDQKNMITYRGILMEVEMHLEMGNFEKAAKAIPQAEEIIKKYNLRLSKHRQIINSYNYAYIYFGAGHYASAKKYINKVLAEDPARDVGQDRKVIARILNLIISVEQKDEDIIEYTIRSIYRFLYKTKRVYKFESLWLDFIRRKLPRVKNQTQLINSFKEIRKKSTVLLKDPFERNALEHFDFISWLDSKIENRPFGEVVREKAKA